VEKVAKNVDYFCNFQKMSKVSNRPMGENLPNLVTLLAMNDWRGKTAKQK
jgi:hypothetical protein